MERRKFLKGMLVLGAGLVLAPSVGFARGEFAITFKDAEHIITGGKAISSDKLSLTVPEIAENGKVVPVKVSVDYPMEDGNYIKAIHVLSTKNGNARAASVHLTPMNGEAYFSTRIKLGGTQDVVAIAQTSKGEFFKVAKPVKVTIGGCG